jgi:hypothetical protein
MTVNRADTARLSSASPPRNRRSRVPNGVIEGLLLALAAVSPMAPILQLLGAERTLRKISANLRPQ